MGSLSRRKGASYEREIVNLFRTILPRDDVRRGYQARGGAECPDVNVCDVLWIECKRKKLPNIRSAMKQAIEDAPKGRVPCAVTKADRDPLGSLITLQIEDFLEIFETYWKHVNE